MESSPSFNPYQTPPNVLDDTRTAEGVVHSETVQILQKTRPWVLLMGVLGVIFALLFVVGGIVGAVFIAAAASANNGPGGGAVAIALVYCAMGLLYLAPAIYLMRYAKGIKRLTAQPTVAELNTTLTAQKSFWKFVGISLTLFIGLYVVILAVAAVAGGITMLGANGGI